MECMIVFILFYNPELEKQLIVAQFFLEKGTVLMKYSLLKNKVISMSS